MSSSAEVLPRPPGRFITFEGGEGTGKSTQVRLLVQRLQAAGHDVLATREPGGTPTAEALRAALLSGAVAPFGPAAEALAFSAARIDHLDQKIVPALRRGTIVVCDRFINSTRAYQGALGHLDAGLIAALEQVVVGPFMPDLTVILDVPSEVGLARAAARRNADSAPDRFEREDRGFHEALRQAFLAIAAGEPGRCCVMDSSLPRQDVAEAIWRIVQERLFASPPQPDMQPPEAT